MDAVKQLKTYLDQVTSDTRDPEFFKKYPIQFQLGYTLALCDFAKTEVSEKVIEGIIDLMEMLQQLETNRNMN